MELQKCSLNLEKKKNKGRTNKKRTTLNFTKKKKIKLFTIRVVGVWSDQGD